MNDTSFIVIIIIVWPPLFVDVSSGMVVGGAASKMFEHMDYSPLCIRIVCTDMYTCGYH